MPYRLISALVATAALLTVHASPAPQVLRRGVNLVIVDMRVLRGDEQVPDLRTEEVTLLVDGTPRPIVSLEFEPAAMRKAAGGQRPAAGDPQQAPTAAGEAPASRRIVLVVDSRSIPPGDGSRLFKAAKAFIENLAPDDALAVATLPLARGIVSERTGRAPRGRWPTH